MESMEMTPEQVLEKIFIAVLDEARSNRGFAEKLLESFPKSAVVILASKSAAKKPAAPAAKSLKAVFLEEGEEGLHRAVQGLSRRQLATHAKRLGLPAVQDAGTKLPAIRLEIIEEVRSQVSDRFDAAG